MRSKCNLGIAQKIVASRWCCAAPHHARQTSVQAVSAARSAYRWSMMVSVSSMGRAGGGIAMIKESATVESRTRGGPV